MIVYRVVRADPPTVADFRSHEARGRPVPPGAPEESRRLWSGISVYDTEERARQTARDYPRLGAYIAELDIPEGGTVRAQRTTKSLGHYTLWGDAVAMLACVVAVRRVAAVG
jgi:hypothetical protein